MVVQHNLRAMNSNRMLGLTANVQAKSTEKLSSGYKINRAADDAAGLSISEKMRKQIRGLTQASLNAADGISAVQTAEGALTEVHDMLQRMNELAVKAANGTMSEDDRKSIQDEIDQLVDEIDRVAETTKFNETYLLKGSTTSATVTEVSVEYIAPDKTIKAATTATAYAAGGNAAINDTTASNYVEIKDGKLVYKEGMMLYATTAGSATGGSQYVSEAIKAESLGSYFSIDSTVIYTDAAGTKEATLDEIKAAFGEGKTGGYVTQLYVKAAGTDTIATLGIDYAQTAGITISSSTYVKTDPTEVELKFQVGAETTAANKITVKMEAMSAAGLKIDQLKGNGVAGKDSTNADAAVKTIEDAIKKVSAQRSALGAVQNRLEHTIANLDNVVENTTAAESQIRDTDMATEMVKFSNNNILAQAGQAMLAQANQANQGVLSLLG